MSSISKLLILLCMHYANSHYARLSGMAKVPEELYGIPVSELARICHVDLATARRWKRGATCPPRTAILLLSRDLGIFDEKWKGWTINGGELVSPEGWIIARGDVLVSPLQRQRMAAFESENRRLKEQLADLEKGPVPEDQPEPDQWPQWAVIGK
jgi:hypothetical protein